MQYLQTGILSFHLSLNFTEPFLTRSEQFWKTNCLDKYQGAFVCVYDQDYALVIVIQPKKVGMSNLFRRENLAFVYHSILQNHFVLGLSSFRQLDLQISDRVLLTYIHTKAPQHLSKGLVVQNFLNPEQNGSVKLNDK